MTSPPCLIAVVDDEEAVRRALHRVLRSSGFDVETYPGGQAFLEALGDHRPHCLVLDLHMPQMSGLDVLARLGESDLDIATIILTGCDSQEARERAEAAGAIAFLNKPIDGRLLAQVIRSAIQR